MTASRCAPGLKTMNDFRPFRGWRYNPDKVNFQKVLAPPYDVISPSGQAKLYEQSSHNCVRLILNQTTDADHAADNPYTRARDFFQAWCREHVLIQETAPAYYFYRQVFRNSNDGTAQTRSAILGCIKTEPFESGNVIPHEKTLSRPREDRRRLLEATHTSFSPVFGLYEDSRQDLKAYYEKIQSRPPVFEVEDEAKVRHALWVVEEPELLEDIRQVLESKEIYIADGHHRYQTALEYGQSLRQKLALSDTLVTGSDFTLMALVAFQDPGLVIFPTHRLVMSLAHAAKLSQGSQDSKAILKPLREYFEIQTAGVSSLEDGLQKTPASVTAFGLLIKDEAFLLTLKDWQYARRQMPAGHAEVWYRQDVNVISHLILADLWGLPESQWESTLQYTHSLKEAFDTVSHHAGMLAFILRPPQVEGLKEMGEAKELMAQKSTYFYPKLASGLVFYNHDTEGF